MADTKADKILDNLVTTLEGITVANGYDQDIGAVSLKYTGLKNVPATDHPAIFILNMGEDLTPETNEEYMSDFNIWLACSFMPSTVDGDYITEYNRLVGDIKKILLVDIKRGNATFVDSTILKDVTPISDWSNSPIHFMVRFIVKYHYPKESP